MTAPTKEEKLAYAKGYAAGRAKQRKDRSAQMRYREQEAFLNRAFMAALPACIDANNWKKGEVPITSMEHRTALAWDFAVEALRTRRYP